MKKQSKKLLFDSNEWTFERIEATLKVIEKIATEKYGLTYYEPQIEIVTADQMIGHCSGDNGGLPFDYAHWSYGKKYFKEREAYNKGETNLAYELIVNSDPAQAYLIDSNTMTMQALVLAHASIGHSSFFKNNYFIKENMNSKFIIPFMNYARQFVEDCENKYNSSIINGPDLLPSEILDCAHSLYLQGIDKADRKRVTKDRKKEIDIEKYRSDEEYFNPLFGRNSHTDSNTTEDKYGLPEGNLLYFIEKNSPILADWQRELIRIVRRKAQYVYPNICTKMMNEGYASFWHYHLMKDLYEEGYINEGQYMEFVSSHTNVCNDIPHSFILGYSMSINPYYLGFNIFMDIKRICQDPTPEDKFLFPSFAGTGKWVEEVEFAMRNFIDESFVLQYLSPHLCRKLGLYSIALDEKEDHLEVNNIHDIDDFKNLRYALSEQYKFSNKIPEINITSYVPYPGIGLNGRLVLQVKKEDRKMLDSNAEMVIDNLRTLMGINVGVEYIEV